MLILIVTRSRYIDVSLYLFSFFKYMCIYWKINIQQIIFILNIEITLHAAIHPLHHPYKYVVYIQEIQTSINRVTISIYYNVFSQEK